MSAQIVIPSFNDTWEDVSTGESNREMLYFDEILKGFVVITKSVNEEVDNASLEISLFDKSNSQEVPLKNIKLVNVVAEFDTQVVYKFELFTLFPKIKLKDPILRFDLIGSLKTTFESTTKDNKKGMLTSFQPANGANILEGFNFSIVSSDQDAKVVLYDSLIKKEFLSNIEESTFVEIADSLELSIIRTLNIRIRNVKLKNNTLITTLDIEHSSKAKSHGLKIDLIDINFKKHQFFKPLFQNEFPLNISKNGTYTFSFQLTQQNQELVKSAPTLIEINYQINSHNNITTKLFTNIDLLKVASVPSSKQLTPVSVVTNNSNLFSFLTIKYIGNKIVKVGQPFKLKVFISNQSVKDRNLLMIFNSNTIQNAVNFQPNLPKIKTLIQSSSSLLETYSNLRLKSQGVLSLVNEVHFKLKSIDSKDGQNVSQNEIELVALEIGVFNLQGVKLIDLATGETLNCDRLLEIVVEP